MRALHNAENIKLAKVDARATGYGRRFISLLLCLCMVVSMMCNFGGMVLSSAVGAEATGNVMNRIADGDTSDTYIGKLLSEEWGSRYAGRVWTDKSVFAYGTDIGLDMVTDGYDGTIKFNSDFGTIFSALASSQRINEYPPSPIDLVILIDMSGSMAADVVDSNHTHEDYNDPNGERITHSRIYAVLQSINNSIQEVMKISKDSRVAVIGYGATAYTLMELGHYTPVNGKYLEVKNFRNYYGGATPKNNGSASYVVGTVDGVKKLNEKTGIDDLYSKHARNDYYSSVLSGDPSDTINIGFNTDLQAGIYQGFEELYKHYNSKEDVTKTYISTDTGTETVVQRIPVAIVMTDGGSNYALKSENGELTGDEWYNVPIYTKNVTAIAGNWVKYRAETDGVGKGGDATILDILMTASYEKSKVQKKYAKLVEDSRAAKELQDDRYKGTDFRILTVSVDTPNQNWQVPRVYAALDPVHFFNADPQQNNGIDPSTWTQKEDVVKAYGYFEQWQNATDPITITFTDSENNNTSRKTIKFNQLPANGSSDQTAVTKEDVIKNINYNTSFADISSSALTDTFDNMLNEIRGIAFTPLSGDNASGVADSVTYQDALGEYMELKNGAITVEGNEKGDSVKVTGSNETTFDMSMLLYGEMHGLVRAGVYDYQWNNNYMRNNHTKTGYPKPNADPNKDPLEIGWYKGDAETAIYSYGTTTGLPTGCSTAAEAWAQGWVLRLNYKTLAEFVPISGITDDMKPTDVPEQIKHAVYTCYRFADSQEERNKLRRNPIFGEVPESLQEQWEDYFKKNGSYPVGMDLYSGYSGVYRLSDIRVWTEHTGDFVDQTGAITPEEEGGYDDSLYVNIPVSAVPTQLAEITIGADGPISYKDNLDQKTQSTPFRLFYAVGLTEDLILRDAEGKQTGIDVSKISGEYITSHSDPETNNIYFISNWYSNTPYRGYTSDAEEEYRTRGDATVTFSPNAKNRYYLFQKPLPLIAHAYRVTDNEGNVKPVDNSDNTPWNANGAGNGSTTWEDGETGGATWSGGEFIGSYENEDGFKDALKNKTKNEDDGVTYITDAKGYTYPLPEHIENAVITYLEDQLSKVDSDTTEGYTTDSLSFSSDDYFFLCIEYYMPMGGTGKDIQGETDPGTQAVCKVYRMIARKGSAFGSGLHSEYIGNGDMLCWTDIGGNCTIEIEYNSRSDTGDNTRGRPTLEKLTKTSSDLKKYLSDIGLSGEHLDADVDYWTSVQADTHMAALIEQIKNAPNQQEKFDELFDWSVAARTGGIRVGDMFNNMQAKLSQAEVDEGKGPTLGDDGYYAGNVTHTANNYYIPTLSEASTAGEGLIINNYLGNNGRLEVANATLMVTKTLVAPDGFTLTDEQQNQTFDYQVYVQGLTGERLVQRLKWNPFSQSWQKRVESLDILTDNSSLLVDTSGSRSLFCYESGVPRQIVEVYEDGVAKYYYADATGAATKTLCEHSSTDFYYLYLPGSAGVENYHLFASTYEGTTDLTEVGTTAYYPTGMDTSKLPAGDNTNQQFAQEITGSADPLADRPAGSREYWTKEAELIPYEEVQSAESNGTEVEGSNRWDHTENHGTLANHQQLEKFVLVTVIPDLEGTDSTVYSPYSSRTQYMTMSLYFGYTADLAKHLENENETFANCEHLAQYQLQGNGLYDQIIPTVDRPTLFKSENNNDTPDKVAKNTAEFTLKNGEGLLLTGLGNRITYRFTEKLTVDQLKQGYTLKEISHVQQRGSDTVYMPGVQEIPVYQDGDGKVTWAIGSDGQENTTAQKGFEPFAHTNATIWESYATMAAGALGNHHQPGASEGAAKNPSCNNATDETYLDVGKCDIVQNDSTTRHYFYYGGKLVDPHYKNEMEGMSRYVLNPTAHFGVNGETQDGTNIVPAKNPESGYYDYTGVYSVYGDTGYFSEKANYINTIDPEMLVVTKQIEDESGEVMTTPPDKEFNFTLTLTDTAGTAIKSDDGIVYLWKGNMNDFRSSLELTDATGKTYTMPETAPNLDEYQDYIGEGKEDRSLMPLTLSYDETKNTYTCTFTLKANEAAVLYGIPVGTEYTVTEEKAPNYPIIDKDVSGGQSASQDPYTQEGTIEHYVDQPAAGLNHVAMKPSETGNRNDFYNLMRTGTLTVEKQIRDDDGDTVEKEFTFNVTLTPAMNETELIKDDISVVKYGKDGQKVEPFDLGLAETKDKSTEKITALTYTFKLRHGEKVVIDGIPYNTNYTVTESDRDGYNLEYVVEITDDPTATPDSAHFQHPTDFSTRGVINDQQPHVYWLFVNAKPPFLPFTGGNGSGMFFVIGAISLIAFGIVLMSVNLYRKRRASVK